MHLYCRAKLCAYTRQILASFIFYGVPQLEGRGEKENYFANDARLDEKRKLLLHDELLFLSKINWRCHVSLHDRDLVLEQLKNSGEGGQCLAQRMRQVPESAMIRTHTEWGNDGMNSHFNGIKVLHPKQENDTSETIVFEEQLFLQDKNDCGERTWELLSEILVLMFDTRSFLPRESSPNDSRGQSIRIQTQEKVLELTRESHCVDQEKLFELTRKSQCVEDKLNSTGAIGSQRNTQIGEKWSVLRLMTSGWC